MTGNKVWTKEEIRAKLQDAEEWICRGVVAIYKKQTYSEQQAQETTESNGVGFTGCDAYILSSFAKQIIQHESNPKYKQPLSHRQLELAKKKMPKYAGQLAKIANGQI